MLPEQPHQFEDLSKEARRVNGRLRFIMACAGLVFIIQERERVAKFNAAWPYDTTECQHMQRFPFLSCARSRHLQVTMGHAMTSVTYQPSAHC